MAEIINIISQYLDLFIAGGILVFFLLYMIIGSFGGLRKAIYRWITTILFFVLLVVGCDILIEKVWDVDLSPVKSIFDINGALGVEGNTLKEIVENYLVLKFNISDPTVTNTALAFGSVVIRIVVYLVLSIVLYLVYWLITNIIYDIFFRYRKKKDENGKRTIKPNKHKGTGALLSGIKGGLLFVLYITVLLGGPLGIIPNVSSFIKKDEEETENTASIVDTIESEDVQSILKLIDVYQNSIFYKVTSSGEKSIANIVNGNIFTVKLTDSEGKEVKMDLRAEVADLMNVVVPAYQTYVEYTSAAKTLNFNSIKDILDLLSNSGFVKQLLPIIIQVAVELDQVKAILNQYNISAETLKSFDLAGDLDKLADSMNDIKALLNGISYVTDESINPEGLKSINYIDLSSIDKTLLNNLVTVFSNLSLVKKGLSIAANYALNLPSVQQYVGDLTSQLENYVWSNEINNIGAIVSKALDLTATKDCIATIMGNYKGLLNRLDFGDGNKSVGAFIKQLFASELITMIMPTVLENIVLPKIPAQYASLFDFDALVEKGLGNEFVDLISIFKTVKGTNNDPFFDENGKINLGLVANLSEDIILNSDLLTNAIIGIFADGAKGEGLAASLKQYLAIPSKFASVEETAEDSEKAAFEQVWKGSAVTTRYYVVKTAFDDYKVYDRVSLEDYAAFTSEQQGKCVAVNKITDQNSEIYKLLHGLFSLINNFDVEKIVSAGTSKMVGVILGSLPSLLEEGTNSQAPLATLLNSEILSTSLSKLLVEKASSFITIPDQCCTADVAQVYDDQQALVDVKVINSNELIKAFQGIMKLGLIDIKYMDTTNLEAELINEETYNALSSEEKAKYVKYGNFDMSDTSNLMSTMLAKLGSLESTDFDALGDSLMLRATLSKLIADNAGSFITIPDSVKESNITVNAEAITVLNKTEFTNLMVALTSTNMISTLLGGGEINASAILNLLDTDAKLTSVFNSKTLHTTLSSMLTGVGGDSVVIFDELYDSGTTVVKATELTNLVKAIQKLNLIGTSGFNIDLASIMAEPVEASDLTVDQKLTYLTNSSILRATLSKMIQAAMIDNNDGTTRVNNLADVYDDACGNSKVFFSASEVQAIFKSINTLGVTDLSNVNISLETITNTFADSTKADKVLSSKVLAQKISDSVLAVNTITWHEVDRTDNNLSMVTTNGTVYALAYATEVETYPNVVRLANSEIKAIINALQYADMEGENKAKFIEAAPKSVMISYSLGSIIEDKIDNNNNIADDKKDVVKGRITFLNTNPGLWGNYIDTNGDGNELENFFKAVEVAGGTMSADILDELDASYILRVLIPTTDEYAVYTYNGDVTLNYTNPKNLMEQKSVSKGQKINYADYVSVTTQNAGSASNFTSKKYSVEDSEEVRTQYISDIQELAKDVNA